MLVVSCEAHLTFNGSSAASETKCLSGVLTITPLVVSGQVASLVVVSFINVALVKENGKSMKQKTLNS